MSPGQSASIVNRLTGLMSSSLSPAHRRIGQWILDHPYESMFLSSVELARRVQVSQASVIRFAVATGFDGYPDLQQRIREIVTATREAPARPAGNRYQRAVAQERLHLEQLVADLADETPLLKLGAELVAAPGLVTVGLRHCAGLATYFGYLAAKIRPDVRVITHGGSVALEQVLHASSDGAGWLVCFALPRYPVELVAVLEAASSRGLRVLTITDGHNAAISGLSDVLLYTRLGRHLAFDVPVGPLMYAGLLVDVMREADPQRSQDRLDAEERLGIDAGTYL